MFTLAAKKQLNVFSEGPIFLITTNTILSHLDIKSRDKMRAKVSLVRLTG